MSKSNKKKTVEEILSALAACETVNTTKAYKTIAPALSQRIEDGQLSEIIDLIRQKLGDSRFDLYLKLSPRFNPRQMQIKNKEQLTNRLYSPIKADVRESLNALDADVIPALDLLKDNENKQKISAWLLSTGKREGYVAHAKLCYIYISLKLDSRQVLNFEELLLSTMETDSKLSFDKNVGKLFPEVLLSQSPFGQIEKLAYFHHTDAETVKDLSMKIAELQSRYDNAILENARFQSDIDSLRDHLNSKMAVVAELDSEITALNSKVKKAEDKLDFEVHKTKEDSRAFEIAFTEELKRRLSIEIEGMNITLGHVEEPEKSKLLRRISNIEIILTGKER